MTTEEVTTTPLSVSRMGTRTYRARNDKGAELVIGNEEGQFTPGDLLKLAVLGCNVQSSDARFAQALGDDFQMNTTVIAKYLESEDRFTSFLVELSPDLSLMEDSDRARLFRRAVGAISRYCTISHTVEAGASTHVVIDGESQ